MGRWYRYWNIHQLFAKPLPLGLQKLRMSREETAWKYFWHEEYLTRVRHAELVAWDKTLRVDFVCIVRKMFNKQSLPQFWLFQHKISTVRTSPLPSKNMIFLQIMNLQLTTSNCSTAEINYCSSAKTYYELVNEKVCSVDQIRSIFGFRGKLWALVSCCWNVWCFWCSINNFKKYLMDSNSSHEICHRS